MAKEMSHDLNDETTDDVASKVLTTKRATTQPASAEQRTSNEAPQKSGVGKIDVATHTNNQVPRPLPVPPRARPRVPAPAVPEPPASEQTELSESEKTQVYRPNLSDPPLARPSARPTVRPAIEVSKAALSASMPKPPNVPGMIPSAQPAFSTKKSQVSPRVGEAEEDRTRVCPAAVIQGLLKKEGAAAPEAAQSAADEVTRVGEIPIEELVMAERQIANATAAVGHEDVTRSYSFNLNDTPSQVTAPGKRQQRIDLKHEPLVIIQPDRHRRKSRTLLVGLLLLGACSVFFGWRFRSTLERYSYTWKASFLRGIGSATAHRNKTPNAVVVTAPVSISITVAPAEAVLTIDGSRVANPYVAQRPPDKRTHELTVEAPGYVSLQRQVQFDRDLTVVMALAPMPVVQRAAPEVAKEPEPSSPPKALVTAKPISKAHAQKIPAAKPSSAPGEQSNCSPPYLIDAKGIKVFKPECL